MSVTALDTLPVIPRVGVHGHGHVHLANVLELPDQRMCRLVAVADPVQPGSGAFDPTIRVFADLTTLLASVPVDVVGLCTPIHTHESLAAAAMRAGAGSARSRRLRRGAAGSDPRATTGGRVGPATANSTEFRSWTAR